MLPFFHRELDLALNSDLPWKEQASAEIARRKLVYADYFETIKHLLPVDLIKLHDSGLHDAVVTKAEFLEGEFSLWMRTKNAISNFNPKPVWLTFKGLNRLPLIIRQHENLYFPGNDALTVIEPNAINGFWWLGEEVTCRPNGRFQMVICFDHADAIFEASGVRIQVEDS